MKIKVISNLENWISGRWKNYSRFLFIPFVALLAISMIGNINKVRQAREKISEEEGRVEKLRQENETLKRQIESMKTPEFIERQLRDKLGLAKEGETVVILPDSSDVKNLAPKQDEEESQLPPANWEKWAGLFL